MSQAHAATLYWDGTDSTANADGGAGTWNTALTNWDDAATGGANTAWVNASNNIAVFGGTAGTVSLGTGITVGGLQFDTSGYLITSNTLTFGAAGNIATNADATISSVLAGSVAVNKTGSGMLTLTATNTYTGALTLSAGTIRATSNSTQALGTGAATLTLAGGRLELANDTARNYARNTTVTADTTISSERLAAGAGLTHTLGTLSIGGQTLTVGSAIANSGTQGLTFGATTLTATSIFNVTNSLNASTLLTLGAVGDGGNGFGITKTGDGGLNLSAANTYTGTTTISGGYIRLSNATALSGGIGATGGTSALTMNGGYLELANGNFSRALGSGADQFQITGGISGFSATGGARILNIGGAGSSVTWGSSTFNPTTLVLNGTTANNSLDFQNALNLGGSSRGVFVGANTAIMSGIISNGGLTKSGSGTLILTNTSNSFANGVTISGGVLVATADSVLGDSAGSITLNGGRLRAATIALGGADLVTARDVTVNSGGGEIQVAKNNNFTTTGKLSGSGTLTLIDNGGTGTPSTYNFNSTTNDFTGGIIANNAILGIGRLDDSANNIVFNNSLGNTTIGGTAGLRYGSGATSALTFGASGRAIEFNSAVTTGLVIQNNNTTYAITIAKDLIATGAGAKTLWLDAVAGPTNVFSGAITDGTGGGSIGINKSGAGIWSLSNANNTFTGAITVSSTSTLQLGSISSTGGNIQLGNGSNVTGTLEFIGNGDTTSRQVQVGPQSAGSGSAAILNNGSGALTFTAATFNISDPTAGGSAGSRNLTLGGSYTGSINEIQGNIVANVQSDLRDIAIIKTGASSWKLSGNNTYTKTTDIQAGYLVAGRDSLSGQSGAFGNATSDITVGVAGGNNDAGLLIGGAFNVGRNIRLLTSNTTDSGSRIITIGGNTASNSEFSGNVYLGSNSQAGRGVTLTAASGGQVTFSGVIQNPTSMDATSYTVTKSGAGTVILGNANTYTGATTVSQGTLLVNGSLATASAVSVDVGILGGTGAIGGTVSVANGATLAPGASIESLATGALTMASGSTFAYEVANNTSTGADLLAVTGALSLTNVTLSLDAASLAALASGSWSVSDKITLISYGGTAITSGFAGYTDDTTYSFGSNEWMINYNDTTGGSNYTSDLTGTNFVTLSAVTIIPEPGVALLGGLGALVLLIRRRRA